GEPGFYILFFAESFNVRGEETRLANKLLPFAFGVSAYISAVPQGTKLVCEQIMNAPARCNLIFDYQPSVPAEHAIDLAQCGAHIGNMVSRITKRNYVEAITR